MIAARGLVLLPVDKVPLEGATLRVRLLDVSLADAPARLLDEQVITDFGAARLEAGGVPFELRAGPSDTPRQVIVSAHLDRRGDGQVHRGDYITTESYPVATPGETSGMTIRVRAVS